MLFFIGPTKWFGERGLRQFRIIGIWLSSRDVRQRDFTLIVGPGSLDALRHD